MLIPRKTLEFFALMVQLLDNKSLSLLIRDSRSDGRLAMKIMKYHDVGDSKYRLIGLYTELMSIKMLTDERVTNYKIRAEKAISSLITVSENITDSLLIVMNLKSLPEDFKPFSAVATQQKEEWKFNEFKFALRNYKETEKCKKIEM